MTANLLFFICAKVALSKCFKTFAKSIPQYVIVLLALSGSDLLEGGANKMCLTVEGGKMSIEDLIWPGNSQC